MSKLLPSNLDGCIKGEYYPYIFNSTFMQHSKSTFGLTIAFVGFIYKIAWDTLPVGYFSWIISVEAVKHIPVCKHNLVGGWSWILPSELLGKNPGSKLAKKISKYKLAQFFFPERLSYPVWKCIYCKQHLFFVKKFYDFKLSSK